MAKKWQWGITRKKRASLSHVHNRGREGGWCRPHSESTFWGKLPENLCGVVVMSGRPQFGELEFPHSSIWRLLGNLGPATVPPGLFLAPPSSQAACCGERKGSSLKAALRLLKVEKVEYQLFFKQCFCRWVDVQDQLLPLYLSQLGLF